MEQKVKLHYLFFGIAILGIIYLAFHAYLAHIQLDKNFSPMQTVINFNMHDNKVTLGTPILFLVLLLVSNFMYFKKRYWDTFIWSGIIYVCFTLYDYCFLQQQLNDYKILKNIHDARFSVNMLVGILLAVIGLALAIINYIYLKRRFQKSIIINQKDALKLEE